MFRARDNQSTRGKQQASSKGAEVITSEKDERIGTNGLRAVFFDLGGTLFSHLPPQFTRQNLDACLQAPLARRLTDLEFAKYRRVREIEETQLRGQPFFLHKDLVESSFRRFVKECMRLTSPDVEIWSKLFYQRQREVVTSRLTLRTETLTTLTALRSHKLLLAVVSNIDLDYLQPLLERTGINAEFQFVLSSEEAHSCKPDEAIYRLALSMAQVEPGQVLFVGDSHANDVVGPKRLGFKTCWLTADQPADAKVSKFADVVVDSLDELPRLFS